MIQLSFPTRKLGEDIVRVNKKLKDVMEPNNKMVLGVTNKEGITVTGNKASEDLSKYIIIKGKQFAYNPYRVNVGSIGLTAEDQEGIVSPAYIVFKTKETLNPEFLLHYLKSSIGINLIRWYGNRGGVRDALRFTDLCKVDIPDLSLREQEMALERINVFSEKLKSLNVELDNQKQLLIAYRNSILQDAIQGKLVKQDKNDESASILLEKVKKEKEQQIINKKFKKEKQIPQILDDDKPFELPNGWQWTLIDSIGFTVTGKTPPTSNRSYYEGDIPFLNPANVVNGKVSYEGKKVSEEGAKYSQIIPKNSILIVCINGSLEKGIGRAGKIDRSVAFNQQINAVVPNENLNSDYLLLAISSLFFQKQIKAKATGTVNYIINKNSVRSLSLPLPPLNEQNRIVEKVNELISLCDELEKNIELSKQEADKLMQAVLQEAFAVKEEVLS